MTTKFKPTTPVVLYNAKDKRIRVVWKNRTASFVLDNHETKTEMDANAKHFDENWTEEDGWTPEKEVEMDVGNGYKRIHDSDNDRWELWGAGKEVQNDN